MEENPKPPQTASLPSLIGKAVLINFALMLAYMIPAGLINKKPPLSPAGPNYDLLAFNAVALGIQLIVNLMAGIGNLTFKETRRLGIALILAALTTALLGFGVCAASAEIAR